MSEKIELSNQAKSLKIGVYKHFKGGLYQVLFIAKNSENPDQEFVVYKSLEKDLIWIRPLSMFLENVNKDDYSGPRFSLIEK